MASPEVLREQLFDRRRRLEPLARDGAARELASPLAEVDAALERMDVGSYGRCEGCREAIEPDRLRADPLVRLCLDCLSPGERRALEYDLELARGIQADLLPPPELSFGAWTIAHHYGPLGAVSFPWPTSSSGRTASSGPARRPAASPPSCAPASRARGSWRSRTPATARRS